MASWTVSKSCELVIRKVWCVIEANVQEGTCETALQTIKHHVNIIIITGMYVFLPKGTDNSPSWGVHDDMAPV